MQIKPYLESRTVWGLLVLGVTWMAQRFGLGADPEQVSAILTQVFEIAGYALAAYGTYARRDLSGVIRPKAAPGVTHE